MMGQSSGHHTWCLNFDGVRFSADKEDFLASLQRSTSAQFNRHAQDNVNNTSLDAAWQ